MNCYRSTKEWCQSSHADKETFLFHCNMHSKSNDLDTRNEMKGEKCTDHYDINLQQTPFCVINVPKNDQVSKINSTFCRSKWIAFVLHILNSWSNKVNFMADLNSKYVTIENKQHMHRQHRESASSHNLYTTQFQIT